MRSKKPVSKKDKLMQIGTTAKLAGISRQTLQYYLMLGLMEPTEKTPSGRRLFDKDSVERIKLINNEIKKINEEQILKETVADVVYNFNLSDKSELDGISELEREMEEFDG